MKKSLFLYLFILAVLMNVFTYAYFSKEAHYEKEHAQALSEKLKMTVDSLSMKVNDANYFSLENDQNAQDYFEKDMGDKYIPYEKLIPYVKEKLVEFNDDPKGNKYTGQEQLGEQKFIINRVKVLNHRWIIADYNDGNYWGEVLIKYFINADESVDFEVIQSVIYPK